MNKLQKARKILYNNNPSLALEERDNVGFVSGIVNTYEEKVKIGFLLAKTKYFFHIVNNLEVNGLELQPTRTPEINDKTLDKKIVDVLIIGAGVTGCAIARELSKYNLNILLIDKEEDVAMHASSRNDGNVHIGIDLDSNSKKLHYLLRARKNYEQLCNDLSVDYKHTEQGLALTEKSIIPIVRFYLKRKIKKNHIDNIEFCNKKKIHEYEPNLGKNVVYGVMFHNAAEVNPYQLTIALAENAISNGVNVSLETYVQGMEVENETITKVITNKGTLYPKIVVNAAGTFAEDIAIMANDHFFSIHPRKGTDVILDKKAFKYLSRNSMSILHIGSTGGNTHSKGGGVVPTVDNNPLIGPDAIEQPYKEDFSVDIGSIDKVINKQKEAYSKLSKADIITYFSGIRAATYEEDFIVEKGKWTKNIVHAAGIQSPGLTCAPAIAEDIVKLVIDNLGENNVSIKENWHGKRKGITKTRELSDEERDALIKKDPNYGLIVCRCEEISKGEIIEALKSPLPPKTIDGIKRRVRAGMGRCQGGFCQGHVVELLSNYEDSKLEDINKKGNGRILVGDIKGGTND